MVSRHRSVYADVLARLEDHQHRAKLVGRFHTGPVDGRLKCTAHERSVQSMCWTSPSMAHELTWIMSVLRAASCMREPRVQTANHDDH